MLIQSAEEELKFYEKLDAITTTAERLKVEKELKDKRLSFKTRRRIKRVSICSLILPI